mmetsp:Transcript_18243/g.32708  ORF Transcript_18243/g.32708 Transcript_18243/m.32708 type:complete len:187 (+) Transcript_18243:3213-3773(+)
MASRILYFPSASISQAVLGQKAKLVRFPLSSEVEQVVDNLKNAIRYEDKVWTGVGLSIAAPQIGVNLSMFIIVNSRTYTQTKRWHRSFEVVINPRILEKSKETSLDWEGCLSFPQTECYVERSSQVAVQYCNLLGKSKSLIFEGLVARIFQHEIDHLNGVVMSKVAKNTRPITYRSPRNTLIKTQT